MHFSFTEASEEAHLNQIGCSTFPLVFGCWELSHGIFSHAEKERTVCKAERIYKMTTIFTQNGHRLSF